MTDLVSSADQNAPIAGGVVGSFVVDEVLSTRGDVQLSRAHDQSIDRRVLLHVATGASASQLLADARLVAAVSHPSLVLVLGAGPTESGTFAAVGDLDALPLSQAGPLSSDEAARVALDVTGAIDALSSAGLRTAATAESVLVSRTRGGVRGLLDPLRSVTPGASCLSASDPRASTLEVAALIDQIAHQPSEGLRLALESVHDGATTTPAGLARALGPLAAPRGASGRPHRWTVVAAPACIAIVAVAIALAIHGSGGGGSSPSATAGHVPAARIVARIPLGLSKNEIAVAYAFVGPTVWLATDQQRLVRIASRTNQVMGTAIRLAGTHPVSAMVASGGSLYLSDYQGWVLRVDPADGRVTARRRVGKHLTAMIARSGVLWITSADDTGSKGTILRVDTATLKPIGKPLNALPNPQVIEARGSVAWVLAYVANAPQVVRVDAASGARRVIFAGPEANAILLAGHTLWIPDRFSGTVSALDAERMAFTRRPLQTARAAHDALVVGRDLWVTASDQLESSGHLRVERLDARTGRRVGDAVAVGANGGPLVHALGSLWVFLRTAVVRLAPTEPRPALQPAQRLGPSPRALHAGPLEGGTWRTSLFAAPLTFSSNAFAWFANYPEPDSITLIAIRGPDAYLEVSAPRQVFTSNNALRPVRSPAGLLQTLRQNAHVRVGPVAHVTIGGRPALQFKLRAHNAPRHPEVCGSCTLLFPVQESTEGISPGEVDRVSLLQSSGRTLVIFESGAKGYDRHALASTAALLRTFHFKA